MISRTSTAVLLAAALGTLCLAGCGDSGSGAAGAASASATATVAPGAAPASAEETPFPALGIAVRLPPGAKASAEAGSLVVAGASGLAVQVLVSDDLTNIGTFEQQVSDVDLLVKMTKGAEPKWLSKTKNADGTWLLEYEIPRGDGVFAHSINVSYLAGKKAIGCSNTSTTDPQIREAVLLCKAMAPRAL